MNFKKKNPRRMLSTPTFSTMIGRVRMTEKSKWRDKEKLRRTLPHLQTKQAHQPLRSWASLHLLPFTDCPKQSPKSIVWNNGYNRETINYIFPTFTTNQDSMINYILKIIKMIFKTSLWNDDLSHLITLLCFYSLMVCKYCFYHMQIYSGSRY